MNELLENNKVLKVIIIVMLVVLMGFMIFSFPNGTAQENDDKVVSIR